MAYNGPHEKAVSIPESFTPIGALPATLPSTTRGLLVGTAGTVTGTMRNGVTVTALPVIQGINPGRFATITAVTAADIWAIV